MLVALVFTTGVNHAAADDELSLGNGFESLVTSPQAWRISMTTTVNLSSGQVLQPITVGPDATFGVAKRVELTLAHSSKRQTGFASGGVAGGLCLRVEARGCPDIYDRPAVLGRVAILDGPLELAAGAGVVFVELAGPFSMSGKLGLIARAAGGRLAAWTNPNIHIGLTARDGAGESQNRERLNVPVWFGVAVSELVNFGLEAGVRGALDDFANVFEVPVHLSANAALSDTLGVGLSAGFETVVKHGDSTSLSGSERSLTIVFRSRI